MCAIPSCDAARVRAGEVEEATGVPGRSCTVVENAEGSDLVIEGIGVNPVVPIPPRDVVRYPGTGRNEFAPNPQRRPAAIIKRFHCPHRRANTEVEFLTPRLTLSGGATRRQTGHESQADNARSPS